MKASTIPDESQKAPNINWLQKMARKRVFGFLQNLMDSRVVVTEDDQKFEFGEAQSLLEASIRVHDKKFYSMTGVYGTIGAAEAYMAGYWDCDDLVSLIRIFAKNIDQVDAMDGSLINMFKWVDQFQHVCKRNSMSGSPSNIARHYDLGNEFFKMFLDKNMMYSSAMYSNEAITLEQASDCKLKNIAEKLDLKSSDHLLEIGSGWGGLAIFMAQHYGCRVTTTTISAEQFNYTSNLVETKGLRDKITVLNKDYRDLHGQFDKLVSVEMIEAVGHQYLSEYMRICNQLLKPGGKILLQAITMPEQHYLQALKQTDFIQKYIFPGGCLPSIEVILKNSGEHTQFQLRDLKDITLSYADTLKDWRNQFALNYQQIKSQGYDDSFLRMWEFYFCYCEGGFRESTIGTSQLLFEKAGARIR